MDSQRSVKVHFVAGMLLGILTGISSASADIVFDGTIGPNTIGTTLTGNMTIAESDGQTFGNNLFHSFSSFNVNTGQSADFTTVTPKLDNIVGRVTGAGASNIDGAITSTTSNAALWLVNPSGVVLGPGSTVNTLGSFHVTTADYVKLSDGRIYLSDGSSPPILSTPGLDTFGFLGSTGAVTASGNITVGSGESISLIGNQVAIAGVGYGFGAPTSTTDRAYLWAPGGRINVAALSGISRPAVAGELSLDANGLRMANESARGNVDISHATLQVNGGGGGSIYIKSGNFIFGESGLPVNNFNRSSIMSNTASSGSVSGGKIDIDASMITIHKGEITANNASTSGAAGADISLTSSGVINVGVGGWGSTSIITATNGTGDAGNISVSGNGIVLNDSFVTSSAAGGLADGTSGNITISGGSGNVLIDGSVLSSRVLWGTGLAGSIDITASNTTIRDTDIKSELGPSSIAGIGDPLPAITVSSIGGNILIEDTSGTFANRISAVTYGGVDSAEVTLTADNITVNNAWIQSNGFGGPGSGDSGDINLLAENNVVLTGAILLADAIGIGTGNSGAVNVISNTGGITINQGALSTATDGSGNGGQVTVRANAGDVTIAGTALSGTSTGAGAPGRLLVEGTNIFTDSARFQTEVADSTVPQPANIMLDATNQLSLINNTSIMSRTTGTATAGQVKLEGASVNISSSTISVSTSGDGDAGLVDIHATSGDITTVLGAWISSETYSTTGGNAGSITITADLGDVSIDGGSVIRSDSVFANSGSAGSILINSNNTSILNNSLVSTSVDSVNAGVTKVAEINIDSTGGSILIDSGSFISSSTNGSVNAGNISLTADTVNVIGRGWLTANTSGTGAGIGNAGDISLTANTGNITLDSAVILSGSNGDGNAGSVTITALAGDVLIGNLTSIASSVWNTSGGLLTTSGTAGTVDIDATNVSILGSQVSTDVDSLFTPVPLLPTAAIDITASGGSVLIDGAATSVTSTAHGTIGAGNITISGADVILIGSEVTASTFGNGDAGAVGVEATATDVILRDGAIISTSTSSQGNAGTVDVIAAGTVSVGTALDTVVNSKIKSESTGWLGSAGIVNIFASNIELNKQGEISTTTNRGDNLGLAAQIKLTATSNISINGVGSKIASSTSSVADAGGITLNTGNLIISDGSIEALTSGSGSAGSINASSVSIVMDGLSKVIADTSGSGFGGSITFNASDTIDLRTISGFSGSLVSASSTGSGQAGDINLSAPNLIIAGGVKTEASGTGHGGSISLNADTLQQSGIDGIRTNTNSAGNAGQITIDVTQAALLNGLVTSTAEVGSTGNAGNMQITSGNTITIGGIVGASTKGTGVGGQVQITAAGDFLIDNGALFAGSDDTATGSAGDIIIQARNLTLSSGSAILATTEGTGNGGSVTVTVADAVTLPEGNLISAGTLSTNVNGGNGGQITINGREIIVAGASPDPQNGTIDATTFGGGTGGGVNLNASTIRITNNGKVSASATNTSTASGGSISIIGTDVEIASGGSVVATSEGTGTAGDIYIEGSNQIVLQNGSVETSSLQSIGGNIELQAENLIYLGDSFISASSAGVDATNSGGNITIDPKFVVMSNSSITANANFGNGGNINITADNFIKDSASSVTASSNRGINGNVEVNSPNQDVSNAVVDINVAFLDVSKLINRYCAVAAAPERSSFVVANKGGVNAAPDFFVSSMMLDVDGNITSSGISSAGQVTRRANMDQGPGGQRVRCI